MKRYMAFGGSTYYPSGGWGDFKGSFDALEEAVACAKEYRFDGVGEEDWWQVVDIETQAVVANG